ncbi:lysophospholipid acyltransferase family protein [Phycisphaera mikurensis]|uniref:Phospholipid/glycerol acyltransferase domain-containing protein n=1 Tax=Phycisphaera mikurensis (strain NBRC 102666 / KCTC 22515 / FYK2301M01) TaxID=1142394 RepID=I0ICE4_PHYMF|nr:lysophospholipid acyltransferase family protein [Phycisphaera mikurensis]MBB6442191.1 hypothetical protein [Phycisphaera mikurensis]BAM02932.1 hypothetical protein PSMK_07730 [Phycisphaera mikurensis NBRC 102666]
MSRPGRAADRDLPAVWEPAVRGFTWYARRYVAKHFHAVRLLRASRPALSGLPREAPVLVVMNHAAWWDPMTCVVLRSITPMREGVSYAPIHAEMLERYGVFKRLGFFGVDPGSAAGGRAFLRAGVAALKTPGASLWVTGQGAFTDPRVRPVRLRPGLAHLCVRLARDPRAGRVVVLPLAVEYPFWHDKTPELLIAAGTPTPLPELAGEAGGVDAAQRALEGGLEDAMDRLAVAAERQDPARFDTVLGGTAGPGGIYGLWGRAKAWARGRPYVAEHGEDARG